MQKLSTINHDRDSAALRYVYPVLSRRAGGVSVGINLNPNNACNWRCLYCQVPGLVRGAPPPLDLALLERELRAFIEELLHGEFMQQRVPEGMRRINDLALSGNGEPTSAAEFAEVIELIAAVRTLLPETVKTVLITNGSLLHKACVQQGLSVLARLNGELWFKLDRASQAGMRLVNNTDSGMDRVRDHLAMATTRCATWLQTCWFALDGAAPSLQDEEDYLDFVSAILGDGHNLRGVLLYGLARPSLQAEAARLTALPEPALRAFAARIARLGLPVKVSV